MDHEVDDPLGGPLDRELEALLAAEPSPDFLARVRTRVATETVGRRWRLFPRAWSFQPLIAVGVAGLVLAVVIPAWLRPEAPAVVEPRVGSTVPAPQLPQSVAADPVRLKAAPTTTGEGGAQRQNDARGGRLQAAQPDEPPFAEVLVSEDEQRAFALLLTRIEEGRLPPVPAPVDVEQSLEPPAIDIPQLVIEPLPQMAALE